MNERKKERKEKTKKSNLHIVFVDVDPADVVMENVLLLVAEHGRRDHEIVVPGERKDRI